MAVSVAAAAVATHMAELAATSAPGPTASAVTSDAPGLQPAPQTAGSPVGSVDLSQVELVQMLSIVVLQVVL